MRQIFLLLFVCAWGAFQPAYAQYECPFPDSLVVADTLDPSGYYPLRIGDVREYMTFDGGFLAGASRWEVLADTLIEGTVYSAVEHTIFHTPEIYRPGTLVTEATTFFTYERVENGIVHTWGNSRVPEEIRFDADFGSCYTTPVGPVIAVWGEYAGEYRISPYGGPIETLVLPAVKGFELYGVFYGEMYGYGVGLLHTGGDPSVFRDLKYALIDSVAYGKELRFLFDLRITSNTVDLPASKALTLTLYPNPVRQEVHLRVQAGVAGLYELSVFNVLGQRIYMAPVLLQAKQVKTLQLSLPIDNSGLFIAQLEGPGGQFTQPFIRVP